MRLYVTTALTPFCSLQKSSIFKTRFLSRKNDENLRWLFSDAINFKIFQLNLFRCLPVLKKFLRDIFAMKFYKKYLECTAEESGSYFFFLWVSMPGSVFCLVASFHRSFHRGGHFFCFLEQKTLLMGIGTFRFIAKVKVG